MQTSEQKRNLKQVLVYTQAGQILFEHYQTEETKTTIIQGDRAKETEI